ncbi:MAG: DUF6359 domain-containing protein [Dysgonomonas sp.]
MIKKYHLFSFFLVIVLLSNIQFVHAGDGTENNPFTVTEAIKVKDQSKLYWVKGYVVGEIEDYSNNKYFLNFTPPFIGRCNWLLADSKAESDLSKCIPIQIKTGELCDTLNLDWNPKFWKKEVMVYGKFRDYYATWGMKFIEEIRILSPYPLEDETIGYPEDPDPEKPDPGEPGSDLPPYIYEDFNTIMKEEPNFDIGKELDRFTTQKGWYGQYVTTAKGKIRLGFESSKGWVQTPPANLSGNGGNYIVSFDAWDFGNSKEFKRISVYVHKGQEHIQTQEVIINENQNNYTFKGKYGGDDVVFTFTAQKATKNRFYLDNVDIKVDESATTDPYAAYFEDFEDGLKELDVDFLTVYEAGEYVGANGKWNLVGAKLDEDDSAKKIGRKSVVIRLTDNQEGDPGYLEMLQSKPNGAKEISFYAANYGSEKGAKLYVDYTLDEGKTWNRIADNISITSDLTKYTYEVNLNGNIRFRIGKSDQTPMRACIDDVEIVSYKNASSIESGSKEDKIKVIKTENGVSVYTSISNNISVYNTTGTLIYNSEEADNGWHNINLPQKGVYILKTKNQSVKVIY